MIRPATLFAAALCVTAPARAGQMLAQQPPLTLAQDFRVSVTGGPPAGKFTVMQWQANPLTTSGLDVPVTWMLSRMTGVAPPPPFSVSQAGVANHAGATGVQIVGATIAAYMNSLDFSAKGTAQNLVGIFPTYTFSGTPVLPFAQGKTLVYALQAQVPTAIVTPPASNPGYTGTAYIGLDLTFQDTTHAATPAITLAIHAFAYPHAAAPESIGAFGGAGRLLAQTSLDPASAYSTMLPTSQPFQPQPWSGFRTLQAGVTPQNFTAVLAGIRASVALLQSAGLTPADYSAAPADYSLTQFHVNAELNYAGGTTAAYTGGSVQMGYAVRNIRVSLQDANDCTVTHNGVDGTLGLENGDQHFLCGKATWYVCGSAARSWATTAATGKIVSPYQCNGSAWVPGH